MISHEIFRAYDIRGNSENLDEKVAFVFAKCFGKYVFQKDSQSSVVRKKICIGIDGRANSKKLFDALCEGFESLGIDIIFLGCIPTPTLYFGNLFFNPDASIMITGSHNPPEHNGFKITLKNEPFCGEQIQELKNKMIEYYDANSKEIADYSSKENISIENLQQMIVERYIDDIKQDINILNNIKVVFDLGNGASCNVVNQLVKFLPNKNILLNNFVSSDFVGRGPDPSKKFALDGLIDTIKKEGYDLGIAFDGDADRIVAITESGIILAGDELFAIFASSILESNHNGIVISDVKVSQFLVDDLISKGGNVLVWKTGHSWIKQKMKEINALFAGEMSGHIFFNDRYHGYDDGIYAALRLIEIVAQNNNSLDSLHQKLPKIYRRKEVKIHVDDNAKFDLVSQIFQYAQMQNFEINHIDGIRVVVKDGWWLIRASNTEAIIILMYEGLNKDGFELAELQSTSAIKYVGLKYD